MGSVASSEQIVEKEENVNGRGGSEDGRLQGLDGPTLTLFYQLLRSLQNSTTSYNNGSNFQLKPIFSHNYIFFIFIYGLLGFFGVYLNFYFVWRCFRLQLHRVSLYYFLIHIAITHVLSSALILPTSLAILLSRYWIFGDFMCYTLTMVQDLPSRVVLLLFVLIAVDRYRQFAYNSLDALPRHGCVIGVWLISCCLAFPACIFVEFYDMQEYFRLDLLRGIGLCVVNNHSMEEYARAMFVIVYVVPLAIFAFAFTRISVELPRQEQPIVLAQLPTPVHWNGNRAGAGAGAGAGTGAGAGPGGMDDWQFTPQLDNGMVNADVERRVQRYLAACGVLAAVSSLPLNVMSVIQFGLTEDYADKSAMYDVTYAIFVWISFIPTVGTPALCLAMMSIAGCPLFYRLLKRWRESNVDSYVRRFSDFASASAGEIARLYPRMGGRTVINCSDSTTTDLRQSSQCTMSTRVTTASEITASTSTTHCNAQSIYQKKEIMEIKPDQAPVHMIRKEDRRVSTVLASEIEKRPQPRRPSLNTPTKEKK